MGWEHEVGYCAISTVKVPEQILKANVKQLILFNPGVFVFHVVEYAVFLVLLVR